MSVLELTKLFVNALLAQSLGCINSIARLCERTGEDVTQDFCMNQKGIDTWNFDV